MNFNSVRRLGLIFSLVSLICIGTAQAQTGTTSLRGAITDKTGGAIAGAKVTIKNVSLILSAQ